MADQPASSAPDSGVNGNGARASVSPSSLSDRPAQKDSLGFTPYVQAVAAFLMHPDTRPPLTLSVEGAWGSGKSSFMLQLQDAVESKGAKTVWFNAWRFDKNEELWAAFALDFTSKLGKRYSKWKRPFSHLRLTIHRFDWAHGWWQLAKFLILAVLFLYLTSSVFRYFIGQGSNAARFVESVVATPSKLDELLLKMLLGAGGVGAYVVLGFALVRKLAQLIGNPLKIQLANYYRHPNYESRATFLEAFHEDFERLVKEYSDDSKVVVFIDDLDRAEVPRAAELMQALNLLISDSVPVFYVLGLDREKVAAGLAAKYEKVLPYLSSRYVEGKSPATAGVEFGYSFLEKFIQLPFIVPQPRGDDVDRLLDSFSEVKRDDSESGLNSDVDAGLLVELSSDSDAVRSIVRMVAPSLDYNPRVLKQFVNVFRLRALLASQTGLFGPSRDPDRFHPLTFEQLGKLVALALRWPLLLVDLDADPSLIRRLEDAAWNHQEKGADEVVLRWLTKHNLVKLIAHPDGEDRTEDPDYAQRCRLFWVDIERFLQVAPYVAGRESFESPENGPAAEPAGSDNLEPARTQSARSSGRTSPAENASVLPVEKNEAPSEQPIRNFADAPRSESGRPARRAPPLRKKK